MGDIRKLNLGAGEDRKEEYINVDWNDLANPDVKHDLNVFPYPFEDSYFDEILSFHVLEHLDRPFDVMKEFHRILKPGGKLHIKCPHFSRGFTHPEHTHGFDISFPKYFDKNFTKSGFYGVEFELSKMSLNWFAHGNLLKYYGYGKTTLYILKFFNFIFSGLAKASPNFCSRIWCFWVGGFAEIEFKFICKK